MATNTRARKNSVQSKCEIRRRSICTARSLQAHLLLVRRLGLLLDKFLENFCGPGRGSVPAVAAVLDQGGDGDLGIINRRVGNKPGLVAVEIRELLGLHVAAL